MSIAMGLLIAVLTPLIILQIFVSSKEPYLFALYFVLDMFFIFLFFNFRIMELVIYPKRIHVSFGIIKKKILLSEVLTYEPVSASFGVYTGAGIRFGGDGSLAFITKIGGNAVKIGLTSSRPFVFSTNKQHEIIDVLQTLIPRKGK
jgi:hypothetical protein